MSDAHTREVKRREFLRQYYARVSPETNQPDAMQRSFFRRFFGVLREGVMVDGLLVLPNKAKKKLQTQISAYPYLFGHLASSYNNHSDIQHYLNNRRSDESKQLTRDEFLEQMYAELMELLGFYVEPLIKPLQPQHYNVASVSV